MQLLQHPIDFKLGQLEVAACDKKVVTIAGVGKFDITMDPLANGIVSKMGKVYSITRRPIPINIGMSLYIIDSYSKRKAHIRKSST